MNRQRRAFMGPSISITKQGEEDLELRGNTLIIDTYNTYSLVFAFFYLYGMESGFDSWSSGSYLGPWSNLENRGCTRMVSGMLGVASVMTMRELSYQPRTFFSVRGKEYFLLFKSCDLFFFPWCNGMKWVTNIKWVTSIKWVSNIHASVCLQSWRDNHIRKTMIRMRKIYEGTRIFFFFMPEPMLIIWVTGDNPNYFVFKCHIGPHR